MRSQLDHALTCFKELLKQLLKQINYLQSQLKQPLPFFYDRQPHTQDEIRSPFMRARPGMPFNELRQEELP